MVHMARTGRPRTFTDDEAIDAATEVFWQHGYAGTTMRRLGDGAGVLPGSLHAAFGDKHALFLRALERYTSRQREFGQSLKETGPVLPRLRQMMYGIAEAAAAEEPRGCLLGNTAAELADIDPVAAVIVRDAFAELEAAVAQALARAQREGEVAQAVDTSAYARVLVALMQGLHILARVRTEPRHLRQAVDAAFALLAVDLPESATPSSRLADSLASPKSVRSRTV